MRYKGEYYPSYLADPVRSDHAHLKTELLMHRSGQETYEWYPLQSCIPLLEKHRYACFSNPSHSSNDTSELDADAG